MDKPNFPIPPGFRLLEVGEMVMPHDFIRTPDHQDLRPTISAGLPVRTSDAGYYFRRIPEGEAFQKDLVGLGLDRYTPGACEDQVISHTGHPAPVAEAPTEPEYHLCGIGCFTPCDKVPDRPPTPIASAPPVSAGAPLEAVAANEVSVIPFAESVRRVGNLLQEFKDNKADGKSSVTLRGDEISSLREAYYAIKYRAEGLQAAASRISALEGALRKYGRHGAVGGDICEKAKHSDYPCNCGFDAALQEGE